MDSEGWHLMWKHTISVLKCGRRGRSIDLHDPLLDEGRGVVDQDNEGLRLDELIHHLLQHEVWQQQENPSQQVIEPTADQDKAVLCTRSGLYKHNGKHHVIKSPDSSRNVKHFHFEQTPSDEG